MFSKATYTARREELKKLVKDGIILLFGNNDSPFNGPHNGYSPFRQDSSFLYYFGQKRDGLVGVIDIDNNKETLIGDDIDIEDIVWFGSVNTVADMASEVGVAHSAPMKALRTIIAASTSCRPTATTSRFRSWTCWESIPTSRRRQPASTSSTPW